MALVNLKQILQPAYKNHYAVGAFNIINLEFLRAVIDAAVQRNAPVIVNIAEVHIPYIDMELLIQAFKSAVERANIPVALNLDHGMSFETIAHAVRQGFTSVMFDGSALTFEDNLRTTKEIVRMCHAAGISVEAELGAVGGNEDGSLESEADPSLYTDIQQAKEFVLETGVDALAIAIGNSHGKYKGEPRLDLNRLKQINEAAGIPLVLHGGSGISPEMFRKSIERGIAKINYYTGMSNTALETLKKSLETSVGRYNNYPEVMDDVRVAVQKSVDQQINIFLNNIYNG